MGAIRTLNCVGTVLVLCCSDLAALRKTVPHVELEDQESDGAHRICEIIDLQPDIRVDDGEPVGPCSSQLSRRWLGTPWPFLVEVEETTTSVHMLLRFWDFQCDEFPVDGRPMCEYSLTSVDKQVCVVSQDPHVFCTSIRDDLTHGRRQLAWPMPGRV